MLADVGMRLSDVFGADSIFWVEGKTEETCFPEILRGLTTAKLEGVQILGVVSTDELTTKKTANRVFEIYARVSGQASLLPPALAYMFDRDGRTAGQCGEAERMSANRLHWLPLGMYENYLLVPAALAYVLNQAELACPVTPISAESIIEWISNHGGLAKYFRHGEEPVAPFAEHWLARLLGGALLHDMFNALTGAQLEYDKVKHGLALTRYLIEHPTQELKDLAVTLRAIVETGR